MSILINQRWMMLAVFALASTGVAPAAIASSLFGKQEVDQNRFAVIASPYGGNLHQLLIVKQISNARRCWSESGTSPTIIDPLLVQFDFTDICGRSTDSNGYSIRVGDDDQNWQYRLQVVKRGDDLQLLAFPTRDRTAPELLIGRTRGYTEGFAKFALEPGWRVTERTYQGKSLGHVYLTNDATLASLNAAAIAARGNALPPVASTPPPPPTGATNPATTKPPVATTKPTTKPPVAPPAPPVATTAPNPAPTASQPAPPMPAPTAPETAQKRATNWWERMVKRYSPRYEQLRPATPSAPAPPPRDFVVPTAPLQSQ